MIHVLSLVLQRVMIPERVRVACSGSVRPAAGLCLRMLSPRLGSGCLLVSFAQDRGVDEPACSCREITAPVAIEEGDLRHRQAELACVQRFLGTAFAAGTNA